MRQDSEGPHIIVSLLRTCLVMNLTVLYCFNNRSIDTWCLSWTNYIYI